MPTGVHIGTEDVRACLRQYPVLGKVESIAPPQQSEWHGHNAVFRVECEAGVYFLKVFTTHPQLATEEHHEFQDWVMEQYRAVGVQTPTVIRNAQGHRLTLCAGYPAVLSAEVVGDEFHEEIPTQQESAGRILGDAHRCAAADTPRGQSSFGPLGTYLLRDRSVFRRLPNISERASILDAADILLASSQCIAQELDAHGFYNLPHSAVIYDYVGVHLRVRDNRVCGVLDFELSTFDARIADVGRAMTQFFCIGREAEEDGPARARSFLRGYNSAGWPLEEQELTALPLAVRTYDFEVIAFPILQMAITGKRYPMLDMDELLNYWMMRVKWWEEHGAEVAEQLVQLGKEHP